MYSLQGTDSEIRKTSSISQDDPKGRPRTQGVRVWGYGPPLSAATPALCALKPSPRSSARALNIARRPWGWDRC